MNKTLLPCPFCGGKARWMYRKPIGWVMCKKCGASSAALSDNYEEADCQQEAIAAWNSRADDERLKNALKEIAQLACESVERDKAFARLESEVEAVIKATKKE